MRLVKRKIKTTQLYRKHNSLTLCNLDISLTECYLPWNFHSDSFVCLPYFPWKLTSTEKLLILLFSFLFTNLLINMLFKCKEKCFIKFVKAGDEVQNVFVQSLQPGSGLPALLKISARLRRWIRLNRRLVVDDAECWNRTESQACDWADIQSRKQPAETRSSRSPREMKTWQQHLSVLAAARSCHGHKHIIANGFSHCVKFFLGASIIS